MRRNRIQRAISRRAITMCRRSISAARTCMRFRPTARSSPTRATSMKSKRPARTTRSSSCRWPAAHRRKFRPAREATTTPLYSPDGNHIAWRSMARAGFEADKSSLVVYQRKSGESRNATPDFDRSVDSLTWTPDSKTIFFTAEDHGEMPIYALPLDAKEPREVARLHADDLVFSNDGTNLFFTRMSVDGAQRNRASRNAKASTPQPKQPSRRSRT